MNKIIQKIKQRIIDEHKKHKNFDWELIAAKKIYESYFKEDNNEILIKIDINNLDKAKLWYSNHKEHVDKLYSAAEIGYPPTDILDVKYPELWKPEHWKWYIDNLHIN